MKKGVLIGSLVLNVVLLGIGVSRAIKNYEHTLQWALCRPGRHLPVHIVMLGDSHIQNGSWNRLLGRFDIFNGGVGGYTTEDVFGLVNYYARPMHPNVCFVMAGTNDINKRCYTRQNTIATYQQIADSLRKDHITPVFHELIYTRSQREANRQIDSINTRLIAYCKAEKIDLIDLKPFLCEKHMLRKDMQADGVHLNQKGYEAWAATLHKYIDARNF